MKVRLKAKTLRGKNRIDRGGEIWWVRQMRGKTNGPPEVQEWLVESVIHGPQEMFWITRPSDPHVEIAAEEGAGT